MNNSISKEVSDKLENIKKAMKIKALGLDNSDTLQFILKTADGFRNIYLSENQERTTALQELGKKHSLSQEDILKQILEDKEEFIREIITSLSVYEALYELYLKSCDSDEPPQKT